MGKLRKASLEVVPSELGIEEDRQFPPRYWGVWGIPKNTITWRHGVGTRLEEPNRKILDHVWEVEGHLWALGNVWEALTLKLWKALSHCFQRDDQEGGRAGGREPNSGAAGV